MTRLSKSSEQQSCSGDENLPDALHQYGRAGIALSVVVLGTALLSAMGGPIIAPALPEIRDTYQHIPHIEFWVKTLISVTGICGAIGAPLFGWISDRWGRQQALTVVLLVWGISGVSGMIPQPFWVMLVARAVLGLSLGGLVAVNKALLAERFIHDRQRHMMGMQSMFASIGVFLALMASGWLVDTHWRWLFAIFLLVFIVLPFVYALPAMPVRREATDNRVVGGSVMRVDIFMLCGFGLIAMFLFSMIPMQLPFYLKQQGVQTSSGVGFLLAIVPLSSAFGGRFYAVVSRRVEAQFFFLIAAVIILSGFSLLSVAFNHVCLFVGCAVVGFGFGVIIPHVNLVLVRSVPPYLCGRAIGILNSSMFMGQFFSPILLQPVLASVGYSATLQLAGLMMMCTAIMVFYMHRLLNKKR